MSWLDPTIIDLEKRLLGEMYGRFGVFTNDSLTSSGTTLDSSLSVAGLTAGLQSAKGKEAIHAKYPNEIEYYSCAFEMLNSKGESQYLFTFPIMPNSIQINQPTNTTVTKTMAGVLVQNNPTFTPFDINLNGNFGRRFRKKNKSPSVAVQEQDATSFSISPSANTGRNIESQTNDLSAEADMTTDFYSYFSDDYKTGYGFTKILQNLITASKGLDEYNKSNLLIFYNLSFNQQYVVEVLDRTFSQTKDLNAIWQYSVQMKAVAPASAVLSKSKINSSMTQILDFNKFNKDFDSQSSAIKTLLDPNSRNATVVRRILERQLRTRALNVVGNSTKSSIGIIQSIGKDTNNADDFIINMGEGLLNSF